MNDSQIIEALGKIEAGVTAADAEYKERHRKLEAKVLELQQKGAPAALDQGGGQTVGGLVLKSSELAAFRQSRGRVSIEVAGKSLLDAPLAKNTITGTDGTLVQPHRLPGATGGAFRALTVLDVLPRGQTASNMVEYTRELSFTNDAAEVSEGAQKPESDLTFELAEAPVRTVAHFIKVSKQVIEDSQLLRSYIDTRMAHGARKRAEAQVVGGDGASPNLSGILDSGNHTVYTPASGDDLFSSVNKAKAALLAADYSPDLAIVNPTDFAAAERQRTEGGGDGQFVAGAIVSYLQAGLPSTLWGMEVVQSTAVPEGTFIVLDRSAVLVIDRMATRVELFEQDGDNVQKNLVTVRAELRLALAILAPQAIAAGDITL